MDYKSALASLNDEQRLAVESIDGPVMVVAGPGTGKTQLLSTRAAHILHETDTGPQNILCLTYTNEAAHNMRRRMIGMIGEHADQIVVKTFHSFAAEIMNIFRDQFYNAAQMEAAPDAIQIEIIESILGSLPLSNPLALKFAGQFTKTKDVRTALRLVKEAGLTPEKLKALIELNIAYINEVETDFIEQVPERISKNRVDDLKQAVESLPDVDSSLMKPFKSLAESMKDSFAIAYQQYEESGKTTPISEWKRQFVTRVNGELGLHEERKINNWWLALADVYATYRNTMHERGYFDYSDMLVEVISKLEGDDSLLAQVQERFSYVMIDEFQDTNEAQLRLAHLVADHYTDEGKPNLMVVGDDDQSIFKFQGADINNMLGFEKSYPTAKKIVLKKNYRSTQAVIDAADTIIKQATYRLVTIDTSLNKQLEAVNDSPASIRLHQYPTQAHQLVDIAKQIAELRKKDNQAEIAVIATKHESLEKMAVALQQAGTAIRYERSRDVLSLEPIRTILLVMTTIQHIRRGQPADAEFSALLRHPMFGVEPSDYVSFALTGNESWLLQAQQSSIKSVQQACSWLSELAASPIDSAQEIIETIIGADKDGKSPLADYYWNDAELSYSYLETLSAVQQLRLKAREYAAAGATVTIDEMLRYVQVHDDNELRMSNQSVFVTAGDVVHLLTAHKAKGLEFDHVYIIDAVDNHWRPKSRRGRNSPSNLPLRQSGDDRDDFIRLLFVAATRARTHLTISSYTHDEEGKEVIASPFLSPLDEPQIHDSGSVEAKVEILQKTLPSIKLTSSDSKPLLQERLEAYQLSVTHLLTFLDVVNGGPQTFYERNLLRLPDVKSPQQSFGTAIHAALHQAQLIVNQGKGLSLEVVEDAFRESLSRELDEAHELEKYLNHGHLILRQLLSLKGFNLQKGGMPERSITDVHVGNAIIRGVLDRVDTEEDTLLITDYKTGKPIKSLYTKAKDYTGIKAWKHRTQLIYYALLAEHSDLARPQVEARMTYVEAEFDNQLHQSMSPSAEELAELSNIIEAVWQRIMVLDFPDVSGYDKNVDGIMSFIEELTK